MTTLLKTSRTKICFGLKEEAEHYWEIAKGLRNKGDTANSNNYQKIAKDKAYQADLIASGGDISFK